MAEIETARLQLRKLTWQDLDDLALLDRACWRKGLATEAAREVLRYGFEGLNCNRLVALSKPENVASRRVMEKIGMQYEKIIEYYGVDWVYYGLNRDQWKASSNGSDF